MIFYDVGASFITEFQLLTAILFVLQDGVSIQSPDRPQWLIRKPQCPTKRTLRSSDLPQWPIRKPQSDRFYSMMVETLETKVETVETIETKVETVEMKVERVETKIETI